MEKHNTRDNKMFVSGDIDTQDNKQTNLLLYIK